MVFPLLSGGVTGVAKHGHRDFIWFSSFNRFKSLNLIFVRFALSLILLVNPTIFLTVLR